MEREGSDITAQHMLSTPTEPSNIQGFFSGKTIFVTGGTGFLGRLLVEKLLRSCSDLRKIYVLLRSKKGKSMQQRFQEYFDDPLYERLKREKPNTLGKLNIMEGDCSLLDLGLKEQDKKVIVSEVQCIFHVAATVRFDEDLKTATYINVRGTKEVLKLAKIVQDLKSIIYVSTAYSFCVRKTIDELFYEPNITGDNLLNVVESLTPQTLAKIVPALVGEWPNTYAFTKAIAEDVIKREGNGLPVAVVRPSIVIGTSKEPVSGWINNFYGATGIFVGGILGVIRTMHCEVSYKSDLVPADYVVNAIIAAAWNTAKAKNSNANSEIYEKEDKDIKIYNYISSTENPISWSDCMKKGRKFIADVASPLQVWNYFFLPSSNKYIYLFLHYILHVVPAYIIDFLANCIGKEPRMVTTYEKIEKFLNVIAYFSTKQWIFRNNNTQELWEKLNNEDKGLFEFSMKLLDWDTFFYTFVRGGRVYLLRDPLETVPQGLAKGFKLKIAHYTLVTVLLSLIFIPFWFVLF